MKYDSHIKIARAKIAFINTMFNDYPDRRWQHSGPLFMAISSLADVKSTTSQLLKAMADIEFCTLPRL